MFLHLYNAADLDADSHLHALFFLQSNIKKSELRVRGETIQIYTVSDNVNRYTVESMNIWNKRDQVPDCFTQWTTFDDFNNFYYSGGWEKMFYKYFMGCVPV